MQICMNKRTDLAAVSSVGVRLTPLYRQPVHTSHIFEIQATSAETNVLNISASLGMKTKVLTKLVKDNEIATIIKRDLHQRGIEIEGVEVAKEGPWGYRHQFNIADSGYGTRGARVLNDRAGEIGRTLSADEFDLKRIFGDEGCKILHLSGLVAALSPETTKCCLEIARMAKANGTRISFDLNYRASFWKDREEELRRDFTEIASLTDVLIGNEEDFQLALGIEGPEVGGQNLSDKIAAFQEMIHCAQKKFPNVSIFATTLREAVSANVNKWGAVMLADGNWYVECPREVGVIDRIGGGDAFVGGVLYGLLRGWEAEKCLQFGWATGALVITLTDDYATPVDEDQIWSIYNGNARVKR